MRRKMMDKKGKRYRRKESKGRKREAQRKGGQA